MTVTPIDSRYAGEQNEKLVLSLLKRHGSLSQSELRGLTNFNSSTASIITGRLREKGIILETPGESSRRGAKPRNIRINPDWRFILGVEIEPGYIQIGLYDFDVNYLESVRVPLRDNPDPVTISNTLKIEAGKLLAARSISQESLLGIGVTVSGSISSQGIVRLSSPMGWHQVPLKAIIQEEWSSPVSLYSTRVRLLAESSINNDLDSDNILYLNIANGVGSSIITDGHLLDGSHHHCGEIGHVIMEPDGPYCGCGHRGCLEALISGRALALRLKEALGNGVKTDLRRALENNEHPEDIIREWSRLAESGDSFSIKHRTFLMDYCGRAAAIALNCFASDTIILGGYVGTAFFDSLEKAIRQRIVSDVFDSESRKVRIVPAKAGHRALMLGAVTAVWQDFMNHKNVQSRGD